MWGGGAVGMTVPKQKKLHFPMEVWREGTVRPLLATGQVRGESRMHCENQSAQLGAQQTVGQCVHYMEILEAPRVCGKAFVLESQFPGWACCLCSPKVRRKM